MTRQFTMSHIIADEFYSDGVEESGNNNVNESIDNNVDEPINNNVDEPFNNIEVRDEGDDDVERNLMSMNRKSKAKKKEEKEQKKEEKKDTFRKALKDLKDRKFKSSMTSQTQLCCSVMVMPGTWVSRSPSSVFFLASNSGG